MMRNLYFPSTTTAWNNLETLIKYAIKSRNGIYRVPKHFLIGDRKTNILLTRLRNGCSTLKADLYRVNLIIFPICQCGHANEDAFHYLFQCNLYTNQRLRPFSFFIIMCAFNC